MHRLTLHFDDPALERAYRSSRAHRWRTWVVGTAVSVFANIFGTSLLMRVFPGHRAPLRVVFWVIGLPIMLLGALAPGLAPAKHRSRVVGVVAPVTSFLTGSTCVVVQALIGAPYVPIAGLQMGLSLYVIHTGVGLRFGYALAAAVTLIAGLFATLAFTAPSPFVGLVVFWMCFSELLAMQQGYAEERSRRRMFLQQRTIDEERARSERLLRNMLPEAIAERLKRSQEAIADGHDGVTVLFADIAGFTPMSEKMSPAEVVGLLNKVFSAFDEMAQRHGLEKIKTIGDAYMVVGGLPAPRADHAAAVASMALEMSAAATSFGAGLAMRIGVHSGPVVAGVIGTAKYSYDLWGDTVNTASRMESHGAPGRIQISDAGRHALGAGWDLEERGTIDVKGKGPMRTWWLKGKS
jgi:class 3 adenylate cyclase